MMSMLLVITRQLNACTDTFNDLNVTINKTITWGDHVKGLIRISNLLPLVTRITLYNSQVRPLFNHSDTIWGDKDNAAHE